MLVAAALLVAACGKEAPPPAAKSQPAEARVVKLGVAGPLAGPQAAFGIDLRNGAQLAIDDANTGGLEIGGRKITLELIAVDDGADADKAAAAARELVGAKVAAVIGHVNSHASIAAAPFYAEAGVPQISPVSNPRYTQLGLQTTFRIAANDDQQGAVLARFALDTGARSFVVADNGTAYGKGLADAFEATAKAHGGRVLARVEATAPGFNGVVARVKALKPDLVLFGGIDAEAAALARQMATLGLKTRLMGGDAVQTGNFIRLAGPAGAGVAASATGIPLEQSPNGQAFLRRYQQKFGTDTVLHAPHGYDAVMVIVSAMQRTGSVDPARFLAEIRTTQRHGLTGNLAFDPQGDLKDAPVTLYAVTDGRWVAVQTVLAGGGR